MELAQEISAHHVALHRHVDDCPLFGQWDLQQKIQLVESAKAIHLLSGEALFCRGDTEKKLYLLLSGSVKGALLSEEGNEAIIDLVGTGQWFGGLNIVDNRPHSYSAVALEPTLCMSFDGNLIKRIVDANPVFYREVANLLCERLRAQLNWTEENLLWPVKKRIVIRMENMASRCGTPFEDGLIIQTRISQDVLASMLGVTRQTLNKELRELKQSGVIRKIGSHYWIKR